MQLSEKFPDIESILSLGSIKKYIVVKSEHYDFPKKYLNKCRALNDSIMVLSTCFQIQFDSRDVRSILIPSVQLIFEGALAFT